MIIQWITAKKVKMTVPKGHRRIPKEKRKSGTTLVEMIVTLMLISIMMVMAVASLSSASRIFVRIQKTQYAQSILDTVMTELRGLTKDATGYVKIYEEGSWISESQGTTSSGSTLEFLTTEGYAVLLSTDGCEATTLYIGEEQTGVSESVPKGRLLTRYYFRDSSTRTYNYSYGTRPVARAVAEAYGKGFYMGNYLKVTYSFPSGTMEGDKVTSVVANVELYSDAEYQNKIAEDTTILEFRYDVRCKTAVTAIAGSAN